MKRTIALSLALAAALLGQALPSTVFAQAAPSVNRTQTDYRDRDRYDRGESHTGVTLEGRWVAKRGYDLPTSFSRGGSALQAAALPPRMVIDQRRNVIRVENFNGQVVQQIFVGGQRRMNADDFVLGQWSGSKLTTIRNGNKNSRIVQTFSLADRGRTLVVTTRHDARGTRRDVEFTSVYQRA